MAGFVDYLRMILGWPSSTASTGGTQVGGDYISLVHTQNDIISLTQTVRDSVVLTHTHNDTIKLDSIEE